MKFFYIASLPIYVAKYLRDGLLTLPLSPYSILIYANVGLFYLKNYPRFQIICSRFDTVLTVGLLRPRSLGNLSTSCKYHFKGLSGWPPEEARKPMAISTDDKTSQTSGKEERKSTIIWPSMTREMDSCRAKRGINRKNNTWGNAHRKRSENYLYFIISS